MSFQFPERKIPASTSPSGNTYPAALVARETADLPAGIDPSERSTAERRVARKVLDAFWEDIGQVCSSPFLQLLDRGGYNDQARKNRERIARDHEAEGLAMRRVA